LPFTLSDSSALFQALASTTCAMGGSVNNVKPARHWLVETYWRCAQGQGALLHATQYDALLNHQLGKYKLCGNGSAHPVVLLTDLW
jgi:hypothetical protein